MITVLSIGQKHGYTGRDHLLDDSDLRRVRAVRDAEAPVWLEYSVCGHTRTWLPDECLKGCDYE